jgi:hypothetical protein
MINNARFSCRQVSCGGNRNSRFGPDGRAIVMGGPDPPIAGQHGV